MLVLSESKSKTIIISVVASLRRQYDQAGVLKQISQRQIYPSIQDALDSAHELVANQKSFFDVEKGAEKGGKELEILEDNRYWLLGWIA